MIVDIFRGDYPLCGYFPPPPGWIVPKMMVGQAFEGKVERNGVKKRIIFYVPQISLTKLSLSLDISSPNSLIVSLLHVHCPIFLYPSSASSHCSPPYVYYIVDRLIPPR